MKNLFVFFAIAFSLILIGSCQKDEIDDKPEETQKHIEHLPLKTGNYWIYEHYEIDSLGNEIKKSKIDSVIITGDTIINDKTYSVLKGTYVGSRFKILDILRDSSGYLVNDKGQIKFSEDNFEDTLLVYNSTVGDSTYATIYYKMEKQDSPITIPAGTFGDVLNYKGYIKFYRKGNPFYRDKNKYYAKDIGVILDTYYWTSQAYFKRYERRLVRYHIED